MTILTGDARFSGSAIEVGPYDRLKELGITLPRARRPVANFLPAVRVANLLFVSGQAPVRPGGVKSTGKVGLGVSVEDAYEDAKLTAINLLAIIEESLGSLDLVERIVKVLGFVNGAPDFADHPRVINGCSDLLVDVFGLSRGSHARSAIGAGSLPSQITVEIEMVVLVRDDHKG